MPTSNANTAALNAYKTKGHGLESSNHQVDIKVGTEPTPTRPARRNFSQVLADRLQR